MTNDDKHTKVLFHYDPNYRFGIRLKLGRWHHLAISKKQVYVNGKLRSGWVFWLTTRALDLWDRTVISRWFRKITGK